MPKHRTLIRIADVIDNPLGVYAVGVLSGWRPHRSVWLPLPKTVLEEIERSPGPNEDPDISVYVHCQANLNAEAMWDLELEGPWEVSRVRHRDVTLMEMTKGEFGIEVIEKVVIEAEAIQPDNTPKPKTAIPDTAHYWDLDSMHRHILE